MCYNVIGLGYFVLIIYIYIYIGPYVVTYNISSIGMGSQSEFGFSFIWQDWKARTCMGHKDT